MYDKNFKRLAELRTFAISLQSQATYFQLDDDKFTSPHKRKFFLEIEQDLQCLDEEAWDFLKREAQSRVKARHPTRGWHQLFDTLNEAKGYRHLAKIGCTDIKFIARAKVQGVQTPDLQATRGNSTFLCEVKTIRISELEAERRKLGGVGTTLLHLDEPFFRKLDNTIRTASKQLHSFSAEKNPDRIALIVINFDDSLHEYADEYKKQIDDHIAGVSNPSLEVVLDIKPPFYSAI